MWTLVAVAAVACGVVFGQNFGQYQWPQKWPQKSTGPTWIGTTLVGGKLLLDFRQDTPHFYPEGIQVSAAVWREVYGCSNGIVVLETNITAQYTPAQTATTPEQIEWPK